MKLLSLHNLFNRTLWSFCNLVILLSSVGFSLAENVCTAVAGSNCKCKTSGGHMIDLDPLVSSDKYPLFSNVTATHPTDKALYSYKPCVAMAEPITDLTGPCASVAVCQVSGGALYDVGNVQPVEFIGEPGTDNFHMQYKADDRTTNVYLLCSNSEKSFTVEGETIPKIYKMTLSTKYACLKSGLSTGSILLIVFFVLLLVYLVGGILVLRFMRGARGVEQIPNYTFWLDFPGLIKDGAMFVFRGCKADPADRNYDQI